MKGKITGYDENSTLPMKIFEMGLLPGTSFVILKQAPFRGPLLIEYGEEHTKLILRVEEAKLLLVEETEF